MRTEKNRRSKNQINIGQLSIACRHVEEMMAAGVTENLSIRTLELFADVYAKLHKGGSATPHSAHEVELWSKAAKQIIHDTPDAKPKDYFRVEHGTPRRAFARMVLNLYQGGNLSSETMNRLVNMQWKLAVITLDEDRILNKKFRSKVFDSPEERWAAAGIEF